MWFNTTVFTPFELALFCTGAACWVIAYFFIISGIFRFKYADMPFVFAGGNIAWEGLSSFVYQPALGQAVATGYQIWFFLDIVIMGGCLLYGYKQLVHPLLRQNYTKLFWISSLSQIPLYYYFIGQYDFAESPAVGDHISAISAFILNILTSVEYILTMLRRNSVQGTYWQTGVLRLFGTGLIGVFSAVHFPEHHAISVLAIGCAITDITFLFLWFDIRRKE